MSPSSLSESELAGSGVTVSGSDFPAGDSVALTVAGVAAGSQVADANGVVSFDFSSGTLGAGTFTATLTSGDLSASATFTVTADPDPDPDPDPVYNPSISLSPSEVTQSALAVSGVAVTGFGFPENAPVTLYVDGDEAAVMEADVNGGVAFMYSSGLLAPGDHAVRLEADAEGAWIEATLTVTADETPVPVTIPEVEPGPADLDPELEGDIEVPAMAAPGDTIVVTVDGVESGTQVGVWIFSETMYLGTHTVDADGQVTVTIPTGLSPGTHTISVWTEDGLVGWDTIVIVSEVDEEPAPTDPAPGDPAPGDPIAGPGTGTGVGAGQDGLAATGGTVSAGMILSIGLLLALGSALTFRVRTRRGATA